MGEMIEMKFLAGFVGFTSTEIEIINKDDEDDEGKPGKSYELCPNVAWCVATDKKDNKKGDNDE
eukprot:CAMPEP_0201570288 /NCGR_PEP_ID=MMETSP0190_2-20130828/12487_1 /ASSEMBLY_ACC=CAM_ASM_000263 /TAXON_ID=37353 /ORGANISM="Rosalina sp." /LENGTH=63 /DNA_ID=CAMNT_0047993685 /DNA_START=1101 /DNA_END=1292 /DNA_ORIENTATION=+